MWTLAFLSILAGQAVLAAVLCRSRAGLADRAATWISERELALSLSAILLFAAVNLVLSHLQFLAFSWFGPEDIGNSGNALWNTLRGRILFFAQDPPKNLLGHHFTPIVFLYLPLFALAPHVETLFAQQIVLVSASALCLHFTGARILKWKAAGFALTVSFLLYPPLYQVVLLHFDYEILTIPALMVTLYFFTRENRAGYLAGLAATLLCREETGAVVILLGAYGLYRKKGATYGRLTVLAGAVGLAVAFLSIRFFGDPAAGYLAVHGDRLPGLEGGLAGLAEALVFHPVNVLGRLASAGNLMNVSSMLMPLPFLGVVLSPLLVAVGSPILLRDLLAGGINLRYYSELIPLLLFGLALGMKSLAERPPARLAGIVPRERWPVFLVTLLLLSNVNIHHAIVDRNLVSVNAKPGWTGYFSSNRWVADEEDRVRREVVRSISPDAPVVSENALMPWLIQRTYLYRMRNLPVMDRLPRPEDPRGFTLVYSPGGVGEKTRQALEGFARGNGFAAREKGDYRLLVLKEWNRSGPSSPRAAGPDATGP